jgi:hypothetical protein
VVSESTPATPASVATMIENVFGSAMKYVAGRLTAATVSGAGLSARSASATSSVTTLATVISVTTIPAAANVGVARLTPTGVNSESRSPSSGSTRPA